METGLLARLLGVPRVVTALTPVSPTTFSLPQLELGQIVRAQVAARLTDGSFRVVVDDTQLKLVLPAGTKPGDVLRLRLVAREPQLQFELHVAKIEVNPQVSSTGRLIGQLISEPAGTPLRQAQPVIATPATTPEQLREPLARAVERSGLFYESHQARWIHGDFPIERLREEPQAAITKGRVITVNAQEPHAIKLQPGEAPRFQSIHSTGNGEQLDDDSLADSLVAREAIPVVRQQLDTLESRQMSWHGEVWPGQILHWEIAEQERDAKAAQYEHDWLTRLVMSLPALGDISAELGLNVQGIRIALSAKDSVTAAAMQAAAPELTRALEAAGLGVVALKVRNGDPSQ